MIFCGILEAFRVVSVQWLVVPFAMTHSAVTPITETASGPDSWIGELHLDESLGLYIDLILAFVLGGMPFQVGK